MCRGHDKEISYRRSSVSCAYILVDISILQERCCLGGILRRKALNECIVANKYVAG